MMNTKKLGRQNKARVRIGTLEDMRDTVNSIFDDPRKLDEIPEDGVIIVPPQIIPKLLSKERLRLLREIRRDDYTITQLAANLKRKREHVSRDLSMLQQYGFVEIRRHGREAYPTAHKQLTLTV